MAKSSREFLCLSRFSSAMISIKNKVLDPAKILPIFSILSYMNDFRISSKPLPLVVRLIVLQGQGAGGGGRDNNDEIKMIEYSLSSESKANCVFPAFANISFLERTADWVYPLR